MSAETLRILLIEDDHVDVILTKRALQQAQANYELVSCETLAAGLETLRQQDFHAVLIDLSLPDCTGLDGLKQLAEAAPDVPYVVLTAVADDEWALAALEAGAQDYLIKGQTGKDLLDRTLCYAIQRQQITSENRQLMEELRRLARFDPLTQVLNRQAFSEVMNVEWRRAERHGHPLSCVLMDIDFFKSINDTFGHAAGDTALIRVASVLREYGRDEDFVARFGGEEFCVLLPETPEEAAAAWAERLRELLADTEIETTEGTIQLTASFGVAARFDGLADVDQLVERADQALFLAKQLGRNQVVTYGRMQRLKDTRIQQLAARYEGVLAGEMMSPLSLTVDAQQPVQDVIRAMLYNQVDVTAVIDCHGHLLGRIAETDLVAQLFAMTNDNLVAADVMQKAHGCFADDTPMPRICEFFSRAGSSRVFVVAGERPVGMITAGRVLHWLSTLQTDEPLGGEQEKEKLDSLLCEIQVKTDELRSLITHDEQFEQLAETQQGSLVQQLVSLPFQPTSEPSPDAH